MEKTGEMNRTEALRALGLEEGATAEQIEQAYGILLRRKRQQEREGHNESEDERFRRCSEAYALLRGDVAIVEKGVGKKALNFWRYHKVPIIVGACVIAMIASMVWAAFFRAKPDLNLQIAGEIYTSTIGLDKVSAAVKDALPDVPVILVGMTPLRYNASDSVSITNANKIFVDMALGTVDAFVIDRYIFEKYASTGMFVALDAFADAEGVADGLREGLSLATKDDATVRLYGIDVTKSKLLYDAGVIGNAKVFVIMARGKHAENAEKLGRALLAESPDYVVPTASPDAQATASPE